MDIKNARYIVNGAHESAKLQDMLDGFIRRFVLCPECENPETDLVSGWCMWTDGQSGGVVSTNCLYFKDCYLMPCTPSHSTHTRTHTHIHTHTYTHAHTYTCTHIHIHTYTHTHTHTACAVYEGQDRAVVQGLWLPRHGGHEAQVDHLHPQEPAHFRRGGLFRKEVSVAAASQQSQDTRYLQE